MAIDGRWYFDDGIIAGPTGLIGIAFSDYKQLMEDNNLYLNLDKCTIYSPQALQKDSMSSVLGSRDRERLANHRISSCIPIFVLYVKRQLIC